MLLAFLTQISWTSFFIGASSVLILICLVGLALVVWMLWNNITFLD